MRSELSAGLAVVVDFIAVCSRWLSKLREGTGAVSVYKETIHWSQPFGTFLTNGLVSRYAAEA